MSHLARTLIGAGTMAVLIGTLISGCGRASSPLDASRAGLNRPVSGQAQPRAQVGAKGASGALSGSLGAEDDDEPAGGDADAPAPAAGGLRPLPRPTPTPAADEPDDDGAEPDNIDRFQALLRGYGYKGNRRQLTATVEAVTHSYPLGWDPRVNPAEHFGWWERTLVGIASNPSDYAQQAVYLAQSKFDVVYYVWVSKQIPTQMVNGRVPPTFDFNKELPIVKGIQDEGLFVQISPQGTVVDYLRLPSEYLNDRNHVIPIPRELY